MANTRGHSFSTSVLTLYAYIADSKWKYSYSIWFGHSSHCRTLFDLLSPQWYHVVLWCSTEALSTRLYHYHGKPANRNQCIPSLQYAMWSRTAKTRVLGRRLTTISSAQCQSSWLTLRENVNRYGPLLVAVLIITTMSFFFFLHGSRTIAQCHLPIVSEPFSIVSCIDSTWIISF